MAYIINPCGATYSPDTMELSTLSLFGGTINRPFEVVPESGFGVFLECTGRSSMPGVAKALVAARVALGALHGVSKSRVSVSGA